MNIQPLISVICLCYNQASFVREALKSIVCQTYKNIEIIVVDDASTDNSCEEIKTFIINHSKILFVKNQENLGNCKAFNKAYKLTKGNYIIDLAADDVLLPTRVEKGIKDFTLCDINVGIHFTDVEFIDKNGNSLTPTDKGPQSIPTGDIYVDLIDKYFVNPSTMMVKREVFEQIGGYNENLTYEDFDFWIRSSRHWRYHYNDEVLVKKRDLKNSLSKKQFKFFNDHQNSTLEVCKCILELNKNVKEDQALRRRLIYEIKQSIRCGNFLLVPEYLNLYIRSMR